MNKTRYRDCCHARMLAHFGTIINPIRNAEVSLFRLLCFLLQFVGRISENPGRVAHGAGDERDGDGFSIELECGGVYLTLGLLFPFQFGGGVGVDCGGDAQGAGALGEGRFV